MKTLQVTETGIYETREGDFVDVLDFGTSDAPYFRAYYEGGWYNVNSETEEQINFVRGAEVARSIVTTLPEVECVRRVGDLKPKTGRKRLPK